MSCLLSKPSSLLKNPISRGAGVLPEVRKVDRGTSSSAVISLGFLVAVSRLSEARAKLGSKIFPFDKFLWLIFLRQGDGRFHVGVWVIVFMCCFGDAKALDGVSLTVCVSCGASFPVSVASPGFFFSKKVIGADAVRVQLSVWVVVSSSMSIIIPLSESTVVSLVLGVGEIVTELAVAFS